VDSEAEVFIVYEGPDDPDLELEDVSLYWDVNTPLDLSVTGDWAAYAWYLDGKPLDETASELHRTARDFVPGTHVISVTVTSQAGAEFSNSITLNVGKEE
jgi:membrane carboxypeptidase/penicillin-binding protein PbpC